jgi:hypothetical protein
MDISPDTGTIQYTWQADQNASQFSVAFFSYPARRTPHRQMPFP